MKLHNRFKPKGAELRIPRDLLTRIVLVTTTLLAGAISEANSSNNPSGASVDLINALNESVVVHCWSRESDLGSVALQGGSNYYWSFHPNIFGRTVFRCAFLWKTQKQEFAVWKGSAHADRLPCCSKGPCSYKICPNGFYNALMVDTDDYGPAESWEYFESWLPNPVGGMVMNKFNNP